MKELRYAALVGNGLFILWILYNAMDEGFKPISGVQVTALSSLMLLLALNMFLLARRT